MFQEYYYTLFSFLLSIIFSFFLFSISYFSITKKYDIEKNSAYECGFEPFEDSRIKFDIKFYLISILFIIFDLEVIFLFPWAVSLHKIGSFGYFTMIIFLLILLIGFCL